LLSGNCNLNREDDFKKPDGSIAQKVYEFANSWQETELPGGARIFFYVIKLIDFSL
jgi:hypothetical protein